MLKMQFRLVELAERRGEHSEIAARGAVTHRNNSGRDRHVPVNRHQFIEPFSGVAIAEQDGDLGDIGERSAALCVERYIEAGLGQVAQTAPRRLLEAEVRGDQREARPPRFFGRIFIDETLDDRRHLGKPSRDARFFADGRFYHKDGKARFVATPFRRPATCTSDRFPLSLNTGRIRDQWHTMTRTAKTPRLMAHIGEPFVEIHPADAGAMGVEPADLAVVESEHGRAILRVVVTERQRRGSLFAPMHWTDQYASQARVDALVGGATDPISGQPELKIAPVAVRRYGAAWHAFVVSSRRISVEGADYFAWAPAKQGARAELAGLQAPHDWAALALRALALGDNVELVTYRDASKGWHRFVAVREGLFVGALFAAREPVAISRAWIVERLGGPIRRAAGRRERGSRADRLRLFRCGTRGSSGGIT